MPWSLQAAKRLKPFKKRILHRRVLHRRMQSIQPPIRWNTLHQTRALQRIAKIPSNPAYRTPHTTCELAQHVKTLGDTPTPKTHPFQWGLSFRFHSTYIAPQNFGKRLQVETLQDTPARMSKPLEPHPTPKAPFPMGVICYASNDLFEHRHMGPLRSERFKCFGNKTTHICPQDSCMLQLNSHKHTPI